MDHPTPSTPLDTDRRRTDCGEIQDSARTSNQVSRRAFLGATGATIVGGLAGCTAPGGQSMGGVDRTAATLWMSAVDDAELPTRAIYSVGIDDGPSWRADLMDDILDAGATIERLGPPLPEGDHIYYDETIYQLAYEVTEKTPADKFHLRLDIVQETVTESKAIRFADLPTVDKEQLATVGLADGEPIGVGTTLLYTDAEQTESVLVPDPQYAFIVWDDGSEGAWFVDGSNETTLNTYRYTAEVVGEAAAYGRRMRERFGFELTGLSDAEREIVETAIDERKYTLPAGEAPPDAFRSLVDRFRGREHARGLDEEAGDENGLGGPYIVQYDGEVYWAVLSIGEELLGTETETETETETWTETTS